jgi:sugar-specific transcriptional regulator TrmB
MKKWIDDNDEEQKIHTLISLGVTPCQSRILIFLSKAGASNAKTISKATGINRTDIYRVMPTLQEAELIKKIISVPVKFEAIPIEDIIAVLMTHKTAELVALKITTEKIIKDYKTKKQAVACPEDEDQFIIIPKGKASAKKRKQSIEKSQESIDATFSYSTYMYAITDNYTRIMDALNKGIQVRHIIEMPNTLKPFPKEAQKIWTHPFFKIRAVAHPLTSIFEIYDQKEVILSVSAHPTRLYRSNIFCCNNASILEIAKNYFENIWSSAIDPNEIINKITLTTKPNKKKVGSTKSAIIA